MSEQPPPGWVVFIGGAVFAALAKLLKDVVFSYFSNHSQEERQFRQQMRDDFDGVKGQLNHLNSRVRVLEDRSDREGRA